MAAGGATALFGALEVNVTLPVYVRARAIFVRSITQTFYPRCSCAVSPASVESIPTSTFIRVGTRVAMTRMGTMAPTHAACGAGTGHGRLFPIAP